MAERRPKVLFLSRSIAHFSYYDSVIAGLLDRGAEVVLALDEEWSRNWSGGKDQAIREFMEKHPQLVTSWSVRRSDKHREAIFALRELRSYRSYLLRTDTTPFYVERWRNYLSPELRKKSEDPKFIRWLKSPWADLYLRYREWRTPPDRGILEYLAAAAPSVLVLSPANMRFSEETDYLKAAKALGIRTALPILSWDNLSTKGLIQILPEKVFAWNEYQAQDARRFHHVPPSRLEVTGSPFFDKWFDNQAELPTRAEFCRARSLDPRRKILLYLGSSKNIAPDESWFVEEIRSALSASGDPNLRTCQILVRPHPANANIYKRLAGEGLRVFPEGGALPETRADFADMRASFMHADAAIGINTSGMIDSVLAGVPTFTVALDRYAATQADSKHYRYLLSRNALYLEPSVEAFLVRLGEVFQGRDPNEADRRAFAERFARPRGLERPAGDVVAESVLKLAKVAS